ncbi:GMC family oxidoreductase N-terminal domain-containing protein [Sphingobium sp. JS3065]|uniref:GMC family oxidoreductase n=1 Tax=Sphingobium sp. JS3065 TaxID=2970925 RepID=UPI002264E3BC|nr:GMC family oxidoreductase N-terminal domain-containing protein [Sphingobium sp. JS3065]UZW57459.1 GMC family oxidoreductase N-terminal domain-containing protein [Sphingobium sp. JS3065]
MEAATFEATCDYLVLGGGSAGCVLASRLSEQVSADVILVEAGHAPGPDADGAVVRDARVRTMGNPRLFWPNMIAKTNASGPGLPLLAARVLGGGSSINGMHALRGLVSDYDEWRQLGVTGWSWEEVLPFFKKLETDHDFDGEDHGRDGPLHLRRVDSTKWSGLSQAIATALEGRGIKEIPDFNIEQGDGYGAVPLNADGPQRQSAADAYLTPQVRARPNLSIRTETTGQRLLFDGRRVVGAEVEQNGRVTRIMAAETIVCMGAIHSPAFLMKSGIGPAADLTAAGIPVVADRRGVGTNLINHPFLTIGAHLKPEGRQTRAVPHPCPMLVRYSSKVPGCPPTDMMLDVWERTPNQLNWDPLAAQVANLMILLNKVYSTGSVRIEPAGNLDVNFNFLSDQRDMDRMIGSLHFVANLVNAAPVARLVNLSFLPNYASPLVFKLMQNDWQAQMLSVAGAIGLSAPGPLRDRFLAKAGRDLKEIIDDPEAVRTQVAQSTLAGGHSAGTCRMGDPGQDTTVTDSRCRVVGVDGLRVVDTSIFPTLMAAGTNIPVMMAAEKASNMILEDDRA